MKLLRLYMTHTDVAKGGRGKGRGRGHQAVATVASSSGRDFVLTFSAGDEGGERGGKGATLSSPVPGSSAPGARKSGSRRKRESLVSVASALVNDALRDFTRRLVLCERCRRPCTALYASQHGMIRFVGDRRDVRMMIAPAPRQGQKPPQGLLLFVQCREKECQALSTVATRGGPRWLAKFAEFVLKREWEDVNVFPEDDGTEWYSDTSPEAVQRRRDEVLESVIGLDALSSRRWLEDNDDEDSD